MINSTLIRKNGRASIRQLLLLLNKEHAILIVIAFLVAAPVVVYLMQGWLAEFKYKTPIEPLIFIIALVGFFSFNVLFTLFFSLKVAKANPADVLRDE
jgi:putative ABC transport system permease protein